MSRVIKPLILGCMGGLTYLLIEIVWRGHTHWTMFILGGICFLYAGIQNEYEKWDKPLLFQSIQVAVFITFMELIVGCIVNIWLKWDVWNYSEQPFNFMGQVCLLYSVFWVFVGALAVILDDYLRYWIFREEKPRYKIL